MQNKPKPASHDGSANPVKPEIVSGGYTNASAHQKSTGPAGAPTGGGTSGSTGSSKGGGSSMTRGGYEQVDPRQDCINDLMVLGHVLGYHDAQDTPHGQLCDFIQSEKTRKLIIGMRGVYKTSFGAVARPIQILMKEPNARILIVSNTIDNARLTIQEIKGHLEANTLLRQVMGVSDSFEAGQIPKSTFNKQWSASALTLNRPGIFSEPSITAAGCETQLARRHFTHIIGDDLVAASRDDMKEEGVIIIRPEEVDKAIGWHKLQLEGLQVRKADTRTEVLVILNRWATYDYAQFILDNDLEGPLNPDGFALFQVAAHQPDGSLTWPEVMHEQELQRIRNSQGDFMYWTQYECLPYDPKDKGFPPERNIYYSEPMPKGSEDMRMLALMDLADSNKPDTCFTTFFLLLIDSDNHIWVVEALRERWDTNAKLMTIKRMHERYGFKTLWMEKNLHDDTMKYCFKNFCREQKIFITRRTLDHKGRNKHSRIMRLQPHHEAGAIHMKRDQKALIAEMRDYPRSRYIDALDTLGYAMDLVKKAPTRKQEQTIVPKWDRTVSLTDMKKDIKRKKRRLVYGSGSLMPAQEARAM